MAAAEDLWGTEQSRQLFASSWTADEMSWNYVTEQLNRTVWNNETLANHVGVPSVLLNATAGDPQPGITLDEVNSILEGPREADYAQERKEVRPRCRCRTWDLRSSPAPRMMRTSNGTR